MYYNNYKNILMKEKETAMKKTIRLISLITLFLLISSVLIACSGQNPTGNGITIAVAEANPGSLSQPAAQSIYSGVKLAVDEINHLGGINGQQINIAIYADNDDPEIAKTNAQAIVDSQALLVIGHSSSETSLAAATIYNEAGIPVINASPDSTSLTANNPHYFNITYTAETQAAYMANYLAKIQGQKNASILFADDLYSLALAETFRNTFRGLGGTIGLDEKIELSSSIDAQVEKLVSEIIGVDTARTQPGTLYIAAPEEVAAKLILQLKRKGVAYPIAGANQLNSIEFLNIMNQQSEEDAQPGFFTDGILSTRGLIFDSVQGQTNTLIEQYEAQYAVSPAEHVLSGYDAALAAMAGMQQSNLTSTDVSSLRANLEKALLNLNNEQNVIRGVTGNLYFLQNRQAIRPARFAIFQKGNFVSAMTQFEPLGSMPLNAEIKEALQLGRMLTVNGEYVNVVNVVYTGIDLIEVSDVDIKTSTYLVDFYLWFRYRPSASEAGIKPENIVFTNLASGESVDLGDPISEVQTGDSLLRTYRVTATFKNDFTFQEYPFDQQTLLLQMRNQTATTSEIQYVVDRVGMQYGSDQSLLGYWQNNQAFKTLFGWRTRNASAEQSILSTSSTLGNPQNFNRTTSTDYSLFRAKVEIQRSSLEYIIKSLLPLLITLVLAYITFFLPLGHGERLGVGSTALLTTAFFHLSLADALPAIGYTVAMEYLFYSSYLMATLIVLLETWSIRIEKAGEDSSDEAFKEKCNQQRNNLNVAGKIIYPIILLSTMALGIFVYTDQINLTPVVDSGISLASRVSQPLSTTPTIAATINSDANTSTAETVVLTLSSWRPEDIQGIESIANEFEAYALAKGYKIELKHDPIISLNYDSILSTQFGKNSAADLIYVRPYSVDGDISTNLLSLNDLGISENYAANKTEPWVSQSGEIYGAPFGGVVQGVYYNKAIFDKLELQEPQTWDDFLKTAEILKEAGYIPVANTLKDNQDSEMFQSLAINTIEGAEGRKKLSSGNAGLCFNSPRVVGAFQSIVDLKEFLPPNADEISSDTSKTLFLEGKAAMLFGGSWDLKYITEKAKFEWGVFAPPAPIGRKTYVIFNPDVAIGINKNSKHLEESKLFIEWLMTQQGVNAIAKYLPGFYPLNNKPATTADQGYQDDFLKLSNNYESDARWIYINISAQSPRADEIVRFALYDIFKNDLTAAEAADRLQNGLSEWYKPAQTCLR